MVGSIYKI